MTPPFTCPTRHPHILIGSLQNLQGCHPLPSAHHLQGCTPICDSSDGTQHPTYLCTLQFPEISVPYQCISVGPRQNIAQQQQGTAPRFPTNSNFTHLEISTPAASISCQIMPHVPTSPLTKLCQSQQIANLRILNDKVYPVDGPARNTHSQTQVRRLGFILCGTVF